MVTKLQLCKFSKNQFYQFFADINFIEEDIKKINFDSPVAGILCSRSLIAKYSL